MGQLINAKDLIDQRYGKRGTESREKFRDDAFSFYFGEVIKSRRKELKLSQKDLAELIGKKRPYISRIENGENIRLSSFSLIANALNLSIQLTAI
ncbi:MAG: helix-turn-helix transcriptional regulator [Bacteroidales bacterium]|nr:helix-turn-helix transcriptional regulator [Bacteroidales bacterium]